MEPWAVSDLILFIATGLGLVTFRYGPLQLLILFCGAFPFYCIRLPLRVFKTYYIKSYETQLPYARHASPFEYYCVEGMRWFLTHLNADAMGRNAFFGKLVWTWFYNLRRFRYGLTELGDTFQEQVANDLFRGFWVRSKSRDDLYDRPDIVVFYAPGNTLGYSSAYAYMEFLGVLLMALVEQGYQNPAIFCLDIDWFQGYRDQVNITGMGWKYTCSQYPSSLHIMIGDGAGATALLSTMLHVVQPLKGLLPIESESLDLHPDSAVMISPFAKIAKMRLNNQNDWLTNEVLARFAIRSIEAKESMNMYTKPGVLYSEEWWSQALPKNGMYITYGEEETCAPEIEQMLETLGGYGRVTGDAQPGQLHAWPVVNMFIGRSQLSRQQGAANIAVKLANMCLWECQMREQK